MTVFILGLGRSGIAAAEYFAHQNVVAWDDVLAEREKAQALLPSLTIRDFTYETWHPSDLFLMSPGIPHFLPRPHPAAVQAQAAGIPVLCDIEILLRNHPNATFIGITGTNGKSTTTALITHMLQMANLKAVEGGNIGRAALSLPSVDFYVLELSSFQLERIFTPTLGCAILLNITPDHLERHGGFAGYTAAKEKIFSLLKPGGFSWRGSENSQKNFPFTTPLKGEHNLQNMHAAWAVGEYLGLSEEIRTRAFETFPGLPHRQEEVGTYKELAFVNDSKATNMAAAVTSLKTFDSIYWILGGRHKEGEDERMLAQPWLSKVKHILTIGETTDYFYDLFHQNVPTTRCFTLEKAIEIALDLGGPAIVLLSPATASFDQFKNFEHRGDVFREYVKGLDLLQKS